MFHPGCNHVRSAAGLPRGGHWYAGRWSITLCVANAAWRHIYGRRHGRIKQLVFIPSTAACRERRAPDLEITVFDQALDRPEDGRPVLAGDARQHFHRRIGAAVPVGETAERGEHEKRRPVEPPVMHRSGRQSAEAPSAERLLAVGGRPSGTAPHNLGSLGQVLEPCSFALLGNLKYPKLICR